MREGKLERWAAISILPFTYSICQGLHVVVAVLEDLLLFRFAERGAPHAAPCIVTLFWREGCIGASRPGEKGMHGGGALASRGFSWMADDGSGLVLGGQCLLPVPVALMFEIVDTFEHDLHNYSLLRAFLFADRNIYCDQ